VVREDQDIEMEDIPGLQAHGYEMEDEDEVEVDALPAKTPTREHLSSVNHDNAETSNTISPVKASTCKRATVTIHQPGTSDTPAAPRKSTSRKQSSAAQEETKVGAVNTRVRAKSMPRKRISAVVDESSKEEIAPAPADRADCARARAVSDESDEEEEESGEEDAAPVLTKSAKRKQAPAALTRALKPSTHKRNPAGGEQSNKDGTTAVSAKSTVTPWMTGRRGSRHRAGGDEGGVVGVVRDRGRNSPGLDYSVRRVSGRDEGGFGKGFSLSLCAVPLTQLVPHLGWRCG
jgi:hypothetical protein